MVLICKKEAFVAKTSRNASFFICKSSIAFCIMHVERHKSNYKKTKNPSLPLRNLDLNIGYCVIDKIGFVISVRLKLSRIRSYSSSSSFPEWKTISK